MASPQPSDVWRLAPCLSAEELLVLLALADYGKRIFPSQAALAAKTRLHRTTVNRAIHSLREKKVVQTQGWGKSLNYVLHLSQGATAGCRRERQVVSLPATGGVAGSDRDPNSQTNQPTNHAPPKAAKGGGDHPFDGVDPEAERRIRRWAPGDTEHLATCQRRVVTRVLGELGVAPGDWRRWWGSLCDRWGDSGVPPYQVLKAELDGIGANVRDRVAVLAFRLKIGRVAA